MKTKVQIDHKPLESIFKKKIADINSNRLQRLRLKTMKYDINVEHIPGKDMLAADLLSRDYLENNCEKEDEEENMIHSITAVKQITSSKLCEIREETIKDNVLQEVMERIRGDWKWKKGGSNELHKYWKIRKELSVEEGMLLHRGRIVIPAKLKENILEQIHGGHIGISKAKKKARELLYWPNMSQDIESKIKKCKQCVTYSNNNIKEPIIMEEKPSLPFCKIGVDLLDFGGKSFLTIVDYYSNWIDLKRVRDKTAGTVIKTLKKIFSIHGIAQELRADNMPFGSFEFLSFAKEWDLRVTTSSPHYPKSNGLVERAVGICKQILRKTGGEEEAILLALMEYRNTPLANRRYSPAQLTMGRRLRTKLPVRNVHLRPTHEISDREEYDKLRNRTRKNYDEGARKVPGLKKDETVVVRKDGKWITAKVLERHTTPRSYIILDEGGSKLRRNRHHLKPTKLQFEPKGQSNTDGEDGMEGPKSTNQEKSTIQEEVVSEGLKERSVEESNKTRTRQGRVINRPGWMKDYVSK